jgi:2-hydroxychromene-2-carboxylate isomerase
MNAVCFWFDFISPYSYLALTQAERFAREHDVKWTMRPVLYAAILDATGLVGPAEVPVKRAYSLRDILRAAELLGVPLVGPPAHPFVSLLPLRVSAQVQDDARAPALAVALSSAAWAEGLDLEDPTVVADVTSKVGFDGEALVRGAADPAAKVILRRNTDEALAAGVFGVPTFEWRGELFWGHDRMSHLVARLTGRLGSPELRGRDLDQMPRGAERRRSPARG